MSDRKPQLSYKILTSGKAIVTCTCGWRDPLGPTHPSPFDPAEALVAASVAHLVCEVEPKRITESTTLAELQAQRDLLGVTALMLFTQSDGTRIALVQHPTYNSFIGTAATEAAAIQFAFSQLSFAMLPPESRAMLSAPEPEK